MPEVLKYPGLSDEANAAIARNEKRPPNMQAFALTVAPGKWVPCTQIGNFGYFGAASGPIEIAFDSPDYFMPWDTAMSIETGKNHYFTAICVRNPSDTPITFLLYLGLEATINDRRLHQMGEMRIQVANQMIKSYEGTLDLTADWITVAGETGARREVWLSVERIDGAETPVCKAYWRCNSIDGAKVPAREIGLALDGITRLPFSDRVDVCTTAAFVGAARLRYWIVTYVPESAGESGPAPAPDVETERLVIPPATGPGDIAGIVSTTAISKNSLWKLFDGNQNTVFSNPQGVVTIDFKLGRTINMSRLELVWCNDTDTFRAPMNLNVSKSMDGNAWEKVIGTLSASDANCTKPVAPGQTIYSRAFESGTLKCQYLRIELRAWPQLAPGALKLGDIKLYERV